MNLKKKQGDSRSGHRGRWPPRYWLWWASDGTNPPTTNHEGVGHSMSLFTLWQHMRAGIGSGSSTRPCFGRTRRNLISHDYVCSSECWRPQFTVGNTNSTLHWAPQWPSAGTDMHMCHFFALNRKPLWSITSYSWINASPNQAFPSDVTASFISSNRPRSDC